MGLTSDDGPFKPPTPNNHSCAAIRKSAKPFRRSVHVECIGLNVIARMRLPEKIHVRSLYNSHISPNPIPLLRLSRILDSTCDRLLIYHRQRLRGMEIDGNSQLVLQLAIGGD